MKWNLEDSVFLKKQYPFTANWILAEKLKRSIHGITNRARVLKLRKYKECIDCRKNLTECGNRILRCNSCSLEIKKAYKRKWEELNKERLREKARLWRLNNKEHKREIDRLWRLRNKERKKEIDKAYRQKIKDAQPDPICADCNKVLVGKNGNTKRCGKCYKKHKVQYNKRYKRERIGFYRELERRYNKERREKENQRRKKLGLPLIGNYFKKEEELLFYIKRLFTNKKVIYHDRATLGNGWELDIFIPSLNLAFEYHGRQHYEFKGTMYWKTYEEFEGQKTRDMLKKILCKAKGIILIEFTCYEKLGEGLVLSKLFEHGIKTDQLNLSLFYKKGNI